MPSFAATFLLWVIFVAFAIVLTVYGDSWLVPWHDEVVIARLAQNLAEGKGFRNDLLDDLLTGADKKTYWQMPLYPFALSLWGKLFGFELNSLRWFSRTVGIVSLVLLVLLARNLNLPFGAISLAVLWSATDLTFQFAANFVRPDALTGCLLLLTALLLTKRWQESKRAVALIGLVAGLAVFNHPIALPCWLITSGIVFKRAGWWRGVIFCLPLAVFVALWLCYALSDWKIFLAQMKAHFAHKQYPLTDIFAYLLGSTLWGTEFYIGVPLNAIPLILPVALVVYAGLRERWILPKRLVAFATVLYASVMVGVEAWYPPIFVPFGYLMLAAFVNFLLQKATTNFGRLAILVSALLLWSYQVSVVTRHLHALPQIRQQVANFVSDLRQILPSNAKVLVGSFSPDPTFALMEKRPDITLYTLMPSQMLNANALRQLRSQLTYLIVLKEATAEPLLRGEEVRRWQFNFGGLSRGKKVVVVLLSVSEKRHNSILQTQT